MADCRKGEQYGKGLFIESREATDDALADLEQGPEFDAEEDVEEELVQGDKGPLLVVKRACFTPCKAEGEDWRCNIFQSTCTMGGKVSRLVIDSRSCENMVSEEAVQKLGLEMEKHPSPYQLKWLKKGNKVTVSKRCLVSFFSLDLNIGIKCGVM